MPYQNISLNLPEALFQRIKETAALASLSLEEAVTQFIALSLPPLENDLSPDIRSKLAKLPLLSDTELWNIANSMMAESRQTQLENLAELKKQRQLTEVEQSTLEHLLDEANSVMLRKAEAYRLLARRGHVVFPSSQALAD